MCDINILIGTVCVLFLLSSCSADNTENLSEAITTINTTEWKSKELPENLIENYSLIPLETNDSCIIGKVDKVIFKESRIFILDVSYKRKVFVYDNSGRFLYKFGSYGRGVGEYIYLKDFDISKDGRYVYLLDNVLKKVIKYSNNGEFLSEMKFNFPCTSFSILNDDTYVYYKQGRKESNEKLNKSLLFWKPDEGVKQALLSFDERDLPLGYRFSIFKSENRLYYSPFLKDTVYLIKDDRAIPQFVFEFGEKKIPDEMFKNLKLSDLPKLLGKNKWGYGISDIFEADGKTSFSLHLDKQKFLVFRSNKSKNIQYGSRFGGVFKSFRRLTPITAHEDYFVSVLDPQIISIIRKRIKKHDSSGLDKKTRHIINSISFEDNPVLMKYKIKDF